MIGAIIVLLIWVGFAALGVAVMFFAAEFFK